MSDKIEKVAVFLDHLVAEWGTTYEGSSYWKERCRKVKGHAKSLRKEAACSEAKATHPATGNPIHKATYKAVKDFIDENEIKGRLDIRYGTSKNFVEKLCEIAGYYTEEDTWHPSNLKPFVRS